MARDLKRLVNRGGAAMLLSTVIALAGCAAGPGFNVVPNQETLVKPGMTIDTVIGILGTPIRNVKYRNQPGVTLTYRVISAIPPPMLFDVDFDAEGKVASTSERMDLDRDGRRGFGGFFR